MSDGEAEGWFISADELMQRDPNFVPECGHLAFEADDTPIFCPRQATRRHVFRAGRIGDDGPVLRTVLFFCEEHSAQHASDYPRRTISVERITRRPRST